MKALFRLKSCSFDPTRRNPLVSFSGFSKSSKSNKTRVTPTKIQAEAAALTSLFNEITEILGSDVVKPDETTQLRSHESGPDRASVSCTQGVRENAAKGFSGENEEEVQRVVLEEVDVSHVVHQITSVVREDDDIVSMEERLEKLSFRFEPEIVENVLKRCFKVPHLARRFFDWVKDKDGFSHRVGIYNTMLSIAGEAKDLDMVDELVKEMEKNACDKDIRTWTILISVYGKAKKIGKGLLVFEKMRQSGFELDAAAYNIMIRSLCIARRGDLALEFYKEMMEKDITFGLRTYKMLLDCIAKSEDVDVAQSIADDMVRICEISEHEAFGYLLKSFCVSGKIKEALELIRELKNKEVCLDAKYFEILVKGLCRANRMVDALEIVDIMKRRKLDDSNVYGIIISGYLRQNDVSKALEQFEVIKNTGHTLRVSTYTEIMQHLFKFKQFDKGCSLFSEMIENGVEPDSVAITAVVAGYLGQNRVPEAWKVFSSMEEKGIKPTWKSYSIFVKELCRSAKYDEVLKLLNQMHASKIAIRNDMFSWVISSMEKNGEKEKIEFVKEIQKKCNFYCQEPNGYDKEEEFRQEDELVQESDRPPVSTAVDKIKVQEICRMLSSSRDWERTKESLKESTVEFTPELVVEVLRNAKIQGNAALRFFSWVGKRNGYKHSSEAYNMSIKVAGCGKDFNQMRSLFYEMRRQGCLITQDTWAIMIMQYGRTGLTNIALRTFKEMKDMGLIPSSSTFKCLITVLCEKKGRNVEEATRTFREMIRSGFVPDRELVQDYLGCLCEVGNMKEAKSCLDSLCKIGFSVPVAYSIYIRALCRIGKLEEALSELDKFKGDKSLLDQYTYGSIVHGLLLRGKLQEALAKVNSMKETGIKPSVHVYTSLIVHFFKEKKLEKVLQTCQEMEEEGCEPSVVTYTAMICGYMNLGKVEEAWKAFRNMEEKGTSPDFTTYSKFINCLCQAGKSEDALKLLSEMLDKGIAPSTINFRTVFYGLNREGKQDLARIVQQKKSALVAQRKLHQTSGFRTLRRKSQTTASVSLVPGIGSGLTLLNHLLLIWPL
ncbi:PREDICTED: putative pentatricopeptide repeat-containing protein At5g06400, mitochondrial [Camelina sativa]|uniref:Pentatricopeptide repeat-containing protein At5g06400, mitochondrial n=1 Tax=Camelina sativa TaxID=90675 RepID=A0ABM0XUH6_CAMSA|nr:PREDICTED: putative pentatricopeptide repeat-containing protein At5g06400, mitochondrial [Camelina sativa]